MVAKEDVLSDTSRAPMAGGISSNDHHGRELKRAFGAKHLLAYVVGALIGSGVFVSPGLVAKQVSNMGIALVIWTVSGIICLLGALCFCELANFHQKAGGLYVFIKEAYGDVGGFFTIWTQAFISSPSGMAIMAVTIGSQVVAQFCDTTSTNGTWLVKAVGVFCFFVCFIINCLSTTFVARIQIVLSTIQIMAVALIVGLGLWKVSVGKIDNYLTMFDKIGKVEYGHLSLAFYNALWAYDGWGFICNLIEETRNPARDLWLSNITGIPFVTFAYLILNMAFMSEMTHAEIASSTSVTTDFVRKSLGKGEAFIVPICIVLSCFGSINAWLGASSRALLSASREGHFAEPLSYIHPKKRIPVPASFTICIGGMAWVIVFGSEIQTLVAYFSLAVWLLYGLAIFSVLVLRVQQPEAKRPYKVSIANPIAMSVISCALVLSLFRKMPLQGTICLMILLASIPCYYLCFKRRYSDNSCLKKQKELLYENIRHYFGLIPCVFKEEDNVKDPFLLHKDGNLNEENE